MGYREALGPLNYGAKSRLLVKKIGQNNSFKLSPVVQFLYMDRVKDAELGYCVENNIPASTFYPDMDHLVKIAEAKSYCRLCEIQQECGDFAIKNRDPYGIWGGLTPEDRSKIRLRSALDQHSSRHNKKHDKLHPVNASPSSQEYISYSQIHNQPALYSDFVQRLASRVDGIEVSKIQLPGESPLGPNQNFLSELVLVLKENSHKQPDPLPQSGFEFLISLDLSFLQS